jgi:hypothetical protein
MSGGPQTAVLVQKFVLFRFMVQSAPYPYVHRPLARANRPALADRFLNNTPGFAIRFYRVPFAHATRTH